MSASEHADEDLVMTSGTTHPDVRGIPVMLTNGDELCSVDCIASSTDPHFTPLFNG